MVEVAAPAPAIGVEGHPAGIERPDFEIVPRVGLVLVAIAMVLLIVAIAVNKLWPL